MPFAFSVRTKGNTEISYLINFLMFPVSLLFFLTLSLTIEIQAQKKEGNSLIKYKHKTLLVASFSSRCVFAEGRASLDSYFRDGK
jgi:hypothetical protein